jgi:hypothetical protein
VRRRGAAAIKAIAAHRADKIKFASLSAHDDRRG